MWVVLHITMEGLKDETWAFWLKLTLSLPRRGGEGGGRNLCVSYWLNCSQIDLKTYLPMICKCLFHCGHIKNKIKRSMWLIFIFLKCLWASYWPYCSQINLSTYIPIVRKFKFVPFWMSESNQNRLNGIEYKYSRFFLKCRLHNSIKIHSISIEVQILINII